MNVITEINNVKRKKAVIDAIKRAISILKMYFCTHKESVEEKLLLNLGNSNTSILEELLGEDEATKSHRMYIKRVRCLSCGRELYREIIKTEIVEADIPESLNNSNEKGEGNAEV